MGMEQGARRSRFRRRLRRLWSRLNQPVATMRNAGRARPGPQPRINKKLGWGGSSPLKRSMRLLVYGGGLFLLGMLAWAVPAVLMDHSFALDERCENKALSCGVLASFLVPVLTLALASAFFLLGRLWYLRRRYLRTARSKPQEVVPTAGKIIGEVVGRDELCRVMIADLLDPATRHPHVVVGGIGAGKTALLVRLTKLLADQRAVPVAVRLRDAGTRLDFRKLARERFIADLESRMVSNEEGERVWRQLLREGRIVVLADGLEEALIDDSVRTERDSLIRLAIRQANTARLPLIIASRPHDPLRGTEATIMELEPLSEEAALDYIMRSDQNEEEHRLDWIVETAEVTEAPFYLQIAYQLHRAGLLEDAAANGDDRQPGTRGADRSGLRLRLLKTWEDALLAGHFPPGVALSHEDRMATIEQLSALACIGLGQDQLEVKLEDFEALREPSSDSEPPPPIIREVTRRLAEAGDRSFDIRLAATWGTHLGLVEAHGATVSFPNSILQAYLGSRLIAEAMAQREFREKALKNPGRELLIALVMRSRAEPIDAGGPRPTVDGASNGSPPEPISLREHLRTAARGRTDSKALDLYAALLEIDSADLVLEHRAIGDEIVQRWQKVVERDPRTLNDAKLNLIHRFGEAARTISERRSPTQPAYRALFEIGCRESFYPVQLAASQEIGAGGDDALLELAGILGPPDDRGHVQDQSDGEAATATDQPEEKSRTNEERKQEETRHRSDIIRARLAPLLVGSASDPQCRATAYEQLEQWLEFIHAQNLRNSRAGSGLSLEVALAQGFKYAANRRRRHRHASKEARAYLAERAKEMLDDCDFWFTRLTLLHALTLWHLPDGPNHRPGRGRVPDYNALIAHWCGIEDGKRLDRRREHPFVAEAWRLAVRALETGQPERYIWIDESGIVSKVGSSPTRAGSQHQHNLWIPPSAGWTALNPRAQQLVADVLLLLNLAERGEPLDRDRRLHRTSGKYLPPCLAEDRSLLQPGRPLGMPGNLAPGSNCKEGCQFGLCPYPSKGEQSYRNELSEAFCRRQQRLLSRGRLSRRAAPWQETSPAQLKRFWKELGQPAGSRVRTS